MKLHRKTRQIPLLVVSSLLFLVTVGCASQMRGAELERGEWGIDLSLSGPVALADGVYPVPFPSVGVKHGLSERVQIGLSYVPILHVVRPVVTFELVEGAVDDNPAIPSVYIAAEAGIRTDFSSAILYPRFDVAAVWHLEPVSPYVELGLSADSESLAEGLAPLFSVTMGANWRILRWLDMNFGVLWWGINRDYGYSTTSGDAAGMPWVLTPGGMGAIGINLGFGVILEAAE